MGENLSTREVIEELSRQENKAKRNSSEAVEERKEKRAPRQKRRVCAFCMEKDEDGNLCKVSVNPLVKVLKDTVNTANMIGSQFGWSPLSRMRLRSMVAEEKKKDDFSEFD